MYIQAINYLNNNNTHYKSQNKHSKVFVHNTITPNEKIESFTYNDYKINFGARLNRTPENFYDQKFNIENMPITVKKYLYEDFEERHHMPPAQLQREAFEYLKIADNIQDIKEIYPDEPLFANLKEVKDTKPSSGILLLLKWDAQTSQTPIFKDKNNKDVTLYLLKKVYLEGKTIEELNKDFEKDSTDEIKRELGVKNGKYFSNSTINSLGIKYPNLSYYNSFLATRNDKEYIPPKRKTGITPTEETKQKLSSAMTKWWAGLDEFERSEQIKKMLNGKELSNSIFSKYQGQIMTIAAAKIGFSEKLSDIFANRYSDENFTIDFPTFAEQQREIMLEFWNKDPNFRTQYSQALQSIISDFEIAYNNEDKTQLEALLNKALDLKLRILNKAKEKQNIRKEMQKYAQPTKVAPKENLNNEVKSIDISSSNVINKLFKRQEMSSMRFFSDIFKNKYMEFLMQHTNQQIRKESVAINLPDSKTLLDVDDNGLTKIKENIQAKRKELNNLFNQTHISTAKTNELLLNKVLYEHTQNPLVFKFNWDDTVEYIKEHKLEDEVIKNLPKINMEMKKLDIPCTQKLLDEFCKEDFANAIDTYSNKGFKYYPELNEVVTRVFALNDFNQSTSNDYKNYLKNYNAAIKHYKNANTDNSVKEIILEHITSDYINWKIQNNKNIINSISNKKQKDYALEKNYDIDFSSDFSLKENFKRYQHKNITKYWNENVESDYLDFAVNHSIVNSESLMMFLTLNIEKYKPILSKLTLKNQKLSYEIANAMQSILLENFEKNYPKEYHANNAALNYTLYEITQVPVVLSYSPIQTAMFIKEHHLENRILNLQNQTDKKYEEYYNYQISDNEKQKFYNTMFFPKTLEIFENGLKYNTVNTIKNFDETETFVINSLKTKSNYMIDKLDKYLKDCSAFIQIINDNQVSEKAKDILLETLVFNFEELIAKDINKNSEIQT